MNSRKVQRHKSSKKIFQRFNLALEEQIEKLSYEITHSHEKEKEIEEAKRIIGQVEFMELILYLLLKKNKTRDDQTVLIAYLKSLDNFMTLLDIDASPQFIEEILLRVTKSLSVQEFFSSTIFCRIGERGSHFYIILKGSISILMPIMIQRQLTVNEYLTHLSFLNQINELELMKRTVESNKGIYDVNISNPNCPKITNLSDKSLKYYNKRDVFFSSVEEYMKLITPKNTRESNNNYYPTVNIWVYSLIVKLEEGNTFGESAFQSKRNLRTATVFVNEEAVFGVLNELEFKMSMRVLQVQSRNERIQFILNFNLFGTLSFDLFFKKFWNYFILIKKKAGETIFYQTEERKSLYFIRSGEFDLSCKLNLQEINALLEKFGQRVSPTGRNETGAHIKRFMKIATIKKNAFLGGEDMLFKNKHFFCSAVCISKTADLYSIDLNAFNSILDFCLSKKQYQEAIAEKSKIMIDRLKSFKVVSNIVYKRSSEQQMSKSEQSIVKSLESQLNYNKKPSRTSSCFSQKNISIEPKKLQNHLRISMKNSIRSKDKKADRSEATSPNTHYNYNYESNYSHSNAFDTLKTDCSKKRLKSARHIHLNVFKSSYKHSRFLTSANSAVSKEKKTELASAKTVLQRHLTTANAMKTIKKRKKFYLQKEEDKLYKVCKNKEKENPRQALVYSKLLLNTDYSIKNSYDFNSFISCCLLNTQN